MSLEQRLAQLEAAVARMQRDHNYTPLYIPPSALAQRFVQIIGGQLSNDVPVITYLADDEDLDMTAGVPDPDVTTEYPVGLGNAWLLEGGRRIRRVIVRHDYGGDTDMLMGASPNAGWIYYVTGTRLIPVGSERMLVYTISHVI